MPLADFGSQTNLPRTDVIDAEMQTTPALPMVDEITQPDPVGLKSIMGYELIVSQIRRHLLLRQGKEAAVEKVFKEDVIRITLLCQWLEEKEEEAKRRRWRRKILKVFTDTGGPHAAWF